MRSPSDLRGPLRDAGGLKTLITWAWVGSLGSLAALAALVLILAGGLWWDRDRRLFHGLAVAWGRTCLRGIPIEVELRGAEHARGGPYVITPNHQSMIDLLVAYLLPLPFRTVVKRSWFFSPFGLNIAAAGYLATARSSDPASAARLLAGCRSWLARGISVLIFPEGTRAHAWRVGRFKRGAFELAADTGAPLLPVAIAGTNDVSHPTSLRFRYGGAWIIVEVLPPVSAAGKSGAELRDSCRALIDARVDALRAELRARHGQGPEAPRPS